MQRLPSSHRLPLYSPTSSFFHHFIHLSESSGIVRGRRATQLSSWSLPENAIEVVTHLKQFPILGDWTGSR